MRNCFIDTLNEHEIEVFVYQGKPRSVDEATQLALEFGAFQSRRKRSQMVRQCKGDNEEVGPLTKLNEQLEKIQLEIAKLKNKGDETMISHVCGERGQRMRNCPNRNNQLNHPYNRYHNPQSYQGRSYNKKPNDARNGNQGNAY